MSRKIITYFLIIAVAAPIIISGVISIAPGKAYALTPDTTAAPRSMILTRNFSDETGKKWLDMNWRLFKIGKKSLLALSGILPAGRA